VADDVSVKFGANIEGIIAGVNDVKAQIESLADSAASIRSTFTGVGTAIAELFAVDQIAGYAERMSDLGEQAIRMSSMLGMSVEEVQKLGFAAKMTGGDAESMAMSMGRFERNIAEAQSGTGKAYEAFHNLGISLQDLKTKTPDQLLGQVADAFAESADGATKYAYAVDLGGRTWGQMIPLLDQGSGGLQRMGVTAQQTGSILSQETAEAFAKTHQNIVVMEASLEGVSVNLFSQFIPAINAVVNGMSDLAQWFTQAAKSGGSMREIIILVEGAFDGLVMGIESGIVTAKTAIEGLGLAFFDLKTMADVVVAAIKDLFVGLGNAIAHALTGHWGEIEEDYKGAVKQMQADWAAGMREMGKAADEFADDTIISWARLQERANEMWAALTGAAQQASPTTPKTKLKDAPTGTGSGQDGTAALYKQDIQDQLALDKFALQQKTELLDQEVAQQVITNAQKIDSLKDFAAQAYALDIQALQDEEQYGDLDEQQWNKVEDEKLAVAAKYNAELAKLDAQAAEAQLAEVKKTQEAYKSFFDTIDKDMDQMLQGVLQGTQTWGEAVAKVFDRLAESFIEDIAKMLLKWTAFEAAQAAFGSGSNIAQALGAGVPTMLGGSQPNNQNALTAILTTLSAAVTGNTASQLITADTLTTGFAIQETSGTVIGGLSTATLANTTATIANTFAEGAGGGASIFGIGGAATAVGVASLDVGAWSIPQNGLAFLHAGEMVIPANSAQTFRSGSASISGGAAGQTTLNFTIQAIDTQTGLQFLQGNAVNIGNIIAGQIRNGHSGLVNAARN